MVEHVSAGEEQDGDQADGGPEVAALDDGHGVGCGDCEGGDGSEDCDCGGDDLDPVDGAHDWRRGARDMAGEP